MGGEAAVNARAQILAAIRLGVRRKGGDGAEEAARARLAGHARHLIPARASGSRRALTDRFVDMATAVDTTVARVPDMAAVPKALADYLAGENLPARVVMAPDGTLDAAPWAEAAPMLEIRRGAPQEADPVGVTSAAAGVAETGTLVMLSGPEHPSTLNFMPETHVVVLPAERIVGAYEDAWDRVRTRADGGLLPRTVNHVTGPSRSGDIEQTMLLGAHGPRRLHVILVGDGGA